MKSKSPDFHSGLEGKEIVPLLRNKTVQVFLLGDIVKLSHAYVS